MATTTIPYKVVSFAQATPEDPRGRGQDIVEAAERLEQDLQQLGVDHTVDILREPGTTKKELTLRKPHHILYHVLENWADGKAILWLDADSRLRKPLNFSGQFDVGFISHSSKVGWVDDSVHMWLPTEGAVKLLRAWNYLCNWPNLCDYDDHYRLEIARQLVKAKECRQGDIRKQLKGALVTNPGTEKEDNMER